MQVSWMRAALAAIVAGVFAAGAAGQTIVYVDDDAAPGGDGLSWAAAFNDLVPALDAAEAFAPDVEIWIAEGTYTPLTAPGSDPRSRTFTVSTPMTIRGGFGGFESSASERVDGVNEVRLSGDLNGDDGPNFDRREDNVRRVLHVTSAADGTVIDRVVFEAADSFASSVGPFIGGTLMEGDASFHDCVFREMRASELSGAMHVSAEVSVELRGCTFRDNQAWQDELAGGGAISAGLSASLLVVDCLFEDNFAFKGGGAVVLNRDHPTDAYFINTIFRGNEAGLRGGAVVTNTRSQFVNCIFAGNRSGEIGGAIIGWTNSSFAQNIIVTNCTFVGNEAIVSGGAIHRSNPRSRMLVRNSIFWDNEAAGVTNHVTHVGASDSYTYLQYCAMEGTSASVTNVGLLVEPIYLSTSPFLSVLGPDGIPASGDEDLRLAAGGPCIDSGSSRWLGEGNEPQTPRDLGDLDGDGVTNEITPLDLALLPRRVDDPAVPDNGEGFAPYPDRGAYERQIVNSWIGDGTDAAWGNGANWVGGVPGPSTDVVLAGAGVPVIAFTAPGEANTMSIESGDWTFQFVLGGLELLGEFGPPTPGLRIGTQPGAASLRLVNSGFSEPFGLDTGAVVVGEVAGSSSELILEQGGVFLRGSDLTVGAAGTGRLELRDMALVRSTHDVVIGRDGGSLGVVRIEGASVWTIGPDDTCGGETNDLLIGERGSAEFVIEGGSEVRSSTCGTLAMSLGPGSSASLTIDGPESAWIESNPGAVLSVGFGGEAEIVLDGGTLSVPRIQVLDGSRIKGNGTIVGDVLNSGEVLPGRGMEAGQLGTLVVEGEFEQIATLGGATARAGVTRVRLGGAPVAPIVDRIVVTPGIYGAGQARLGGALVLEPEPDFDLDPAFGGVLELLAAVDVTSEFSVVLAPTVSPDVDGKSRFLSLAYEVPGQGFGPGVGESVQITVNILDGDFDGLGDPIGGDFVGTPVAVASADLNPTDGEDFAVALAEGDVLITTEVAGVPAQLTLAGVGDELTDLVVGDFDGINGPDIAVTARNSVGTDEVVIAFNDGNGFLLPTFGSIAVADEPVGLAAADFDRDGVVGQDIAVISAAAQSVRVYSNNGVGAFIGQNVIDLPRPPKVIDPLQGTGNKQDQVGFVIASDGDGGVVQAFFEDAGAYSSANSVDIAVGPQPEAQALTDFDGDGLGDLVTVNGDGTLSVALQAAGQDFAPAVSVGIVDFPRDLTVLNLEGDAEGDADLAILSGGPNPVVQVLRNDTVNPGSIVLATHSETAAGVAPLLIDSGLYTVGDPVDDVLIVRGSSSDGGWPFPPPNGAGGGGKPADGGFSVFGNQTDAPSDPCPTDLDGNGETDFADLVRILSLWGACGDPANCPEDFDANGVIDFADLVTVLSAWGPCSG